MSPLHPRVGARRAGSTTRPGRAGVFQHALSARPKVEAQLIFVGYGLNIPERNYNDFAGLDLKGKVAVILTGSPADVPSALSAHYQSRAERWKALKAAGAIGIIQIQNPASVDLPWARSSLNRNHPSMDLLGPEFNETSRRQGRDCIQSRPCHLLLQGSGPHLCGTGRSRVRTANRCRIFP